jgi:hypothetical protein
MTHRIVTNGLYHEIRITRMRDKPQPFRQVGGHLGPSSPIAMARSLDRSITVPLLEKYFPIVKDLRTYLCGILEMPSSLSTAHPCDATDTDSTQYHDLLNSSYVALKSPANPKIVIPHFKVFPVMTDMREVSRH